MLLKNAAPKRAIIVELTSPIDRALLKEAMTKMAFVECGPSTEESWGFTPPSESSDWGILPAAGQYWVISIRHDRRVPGKSRLAREKAKAIKAREEEIKQKLTKQEREDLAEAVRKRLLKDYQPEEHNYQAVYCENTRRVYILESSVNKAKFVAEKLTQALKPQNIAVPLDDTTLPPVLAETLTMWLHNPSEYSSEYDFEVGSDMRLESDNVVAVLSNQDSDSAEVREHLAANKLVSKLALKYNDNISFALSAKRILSQIDFKKYCKDSIAEQKTECDGDARAFHQASLIIYMSALASLWEAVLKIPTEI